MRFPILLSLVFAVSLGAQDAPGSNAKAPKADAYSTKLPKLIAKLKPAGK